MKNKNLNNILILNKKFHLFMNNNKSTLESIKTTINSNIKPEEKLLSTNNKKKSIPSLILIKKLLYKKYNTTKKQYDMILLENVIQSKYCHDIAVFKEKILYNYKEEFLKRYYLKKESKIRIPKFVSFYKNYLTFFCKPIFSELNLNDLIQIYSEKKAQLFYNENYKEEDNIKNDNNNNDNDNNKNIKNFIVFTPKIKKMISNEDSLINLTINNLTHATTANKSLENSILKIINDLGKSNNNKKIIISKDKNKKLNSINNNNNNNLIKHNKNLSNNSEYKKKTIEPIPSQNKITKNLFKLNNLHLNKIFNSNNIINNCIHKHSLTERNNDINNNNIKINKINNNIINKNNEINFPFYKKKSRNLIISNPLLTENYFTIKNNQNKIKKENKIFQTMNSEKINNRVNTEISIKNNNIIKINSVSKNKNKFPKFLNNNKKTRNRKNSFSQNFKTDIYSSMNINLKSIDNLGNNLKLLIKEKTSLSKQKLKLKEFQPLTNRGINHIKQYIQIQKKKIKKNK